MYIYVYIYIYMYICAGHILYIDNIYMHCNYYCYLPAS